MTAEETRGECLDADTLAAWADDALSARERADAEAHAANCARCQMMLAAMVRTLPAAAEAASPLRTRALWWMAALAPVAAALVVWFAVPSRAPIQQSQTADAIVEPAAPATAAAEPERNAAEPSPRVASRAPAAATTAAPEEARNAPAPQEEAPRPQRDQKTLAAPSADANEPLAERTTAGASIAAAPSAAPAPSANLRREALSASAGQSAFASPDAIIVSSNPSTRFRLLTGGGVQRSSDGGATWRNEVTGATETLIGGASPSPSVCWLIGRSGVVLLSTDGRSWRRVTSPPAADLRSITATDHENATVTAGDGRVFVTDDGGRTWARPPDF